MFLTLEKLTAQTKDLAQRRRRDLKTLFPLAALDAGCELDSPITQHPGKLPQEHLVAKNDFFMGRDRYLWIQTQAAVPPKEEGRRIIGAFQFGKTGDGFNDGFESLLYVDGKPYHGVDTYHTEVVLEEFAGKTVELTFLLWTGLEGGGPRKEFAHRFRQADIGYLDCAADSLYTYADVIVKSIPLMPEGCVERQQLLDALNRSFACIDWDEEYFYPSVQAALEKLETQLEALPKNHGVTVHCVGHTHIDVAWLWRLKHTREKAIRSFSTVLRLMEQNEDFLFLQSQPQLYRYMQQDCPEIYASIKQRAAQGRWEVDGGMWLEADCNITSGEALVRQFLHGCGFIKEEFGRDCTHLWLPDVFGYSWALPQILRQCNIKTFATTKISWNQVNRMPHDLFWWRGLDGSEVLTYFITTPYESSNHLYGANYNASVTPFEIFGAWEKFRDKDLTRDVLIPFGYGDGGGGVSSDMLKRRRAMEKLPGVPHVVADTAGAYFEKLHQEMAHTDAGQPVWDGELYLEYHRGTFTSQARNKKWNRKLELKLTESEWLASHALVQGKSYPREALDTGWKTVLRNQFHDIIPGSSIHEVYQDSEKEYAAADALLDETRGKILGALTGEDENRWTVWNFSSFARKDLAFLAETREGRFEEENGAPLSACRTGEGYLVRLALEGLEIRTVRFVPGAQAAEDTQTACCHAGGVETPVYTIQWNDGGQLTSIYDRENDREVLRGQGNRLEIYEDRPLRFDAWDIDIYHMEKCSVISASGEPCVIENNALRAVLRFSYQYRKSTVTQDMILYSGSRRIDFETVVDWHESRRLLKAAFDVDVRCTKATYDIQFGHVERPTHFNTSWDWARFEVVGHKWADLSDSGYGVSLLNDCKYGYSAKDSALRLSLLKSAKYPDTEADMGLHTFTYALLPHAGNVLEGGAIAEGNNLNLPAGAARGGYIAAQTRLIHVDNPCVIVDAVKKAEKENCLILRMHEAAGGVQKVTVQSDYRIEKYARCNLLEQESGESGEGSIRTTLTPFEIRTYLLWLKA